MPTEDVNKILRSAIDSVGREPSKPAGSTALDEVLLSDLHSANFEAQATTSFVTIIDGPGGTNVNLTCTRASTCNCASTEEVAGDLHVDFAL